MTSPIRVLSLYEGFFAGGARILHSDLVAGLHAGGDQQHRVLSIASEASRESTVQPMQNDPRYMRLARAGVEVVTLGRTAGGDPPERSTFTDIELRIAADAVAGADVVLSLKEQPLGLLLALRDRGLMPDIPVAACLHRSDPMHSGRRARVADGSGGERAADREDLVCGVDRRRVRPGRAARHRRFVIANGIDTERFRPGADARSRPLASSSRSPRRPRWWCSRPGSTR